MTLTISNIAFHLTRFAISSILLSVRIIHRWFIDDIHPICRLFVYLLMRVTCFNLCTELILIQTDQNYRNYDRRPKVCQIPTLPNILKPLSKFVKMSSLHSFVKRYCCIDTGQMVKSSNSSLPTPYSTVKGQKQAMQLILQFTHVNNLQTSS